MQTTNDAGEIRPVVALMGEFSAGKSTLANLLIGGGLSPVRVTATQLPPIWFVYGNTEPECVSFHGDVTPLDLDRLDDVSPDETAFIKIYLESDVLNLMDIIDMPGISDPNLSAETWQRVIPHAHCVIWCSHATQAWRQSEAATWEELPESLRRTSLLLLTRYDKLLTDQDRARVLSRVEAETDGLFDSVFPVSLSQASEAGDDRAVWESSGAEAFTQRLLDIVMELDPADATAGSLQQTMADGPIVLDTAAEGGLHDANSVAPKRVAKRPQKTAAQTERLPRSALNQVSV